MYADGINEARALASFYGINITAMDTTPAIVVQYVPTLGGGTEGKLKITSQGFCFKVDDTTPSGNSAFPNQTSSGWLTFASQTNMGQMVDAINGSIGWRAYLCAALRGDIASNLLAATETSVNDANGKTFYWDSKDETLISAGAVISGEKFVNNGKNGHVKDYEDGCENAIHFIEANFKDSAATLRFYSGRQGYAETQIGGAIAFTAANTATYPTGRDAGAEAPYVSSSRGQRLIARVTFLTKAKGTPNRFHVLGKTAVLKNDRVVTEDNF